ncbi:MAG: heparinase II/III family protein [Chloroflexi bacterium]|nr:heparinase II/III family protein [Chloroflexota bacterium]
MRRAGWVLFALPISTGLLGSLARSAEAAPLGQSATPAELTPTSPPPPPPATATATATPTDTPATPTATPPAAPTSTSGPAVLTPTSTPEPPGRPMPGSTPIPGVTPTVTRETVLQTLRLTHPRLLLSPDDEARIRRALASDSVARGYRDSLVRNGARIMTQPTPERVLIGPRLLTVSRTVLDRVATLALLYRLDGDPRWAQRARAELLAAAGFSDWNPSHFLDVAEMSHAFALGYDWLYDFLSADERATIRRALVEKGLRPTEEQYATRAGWTRATHNWNFVCNGGAIIGALAVADEEPGLAGTLVAQALASMPSALASYAPDGAWAEGPVYWDYGTRYLVSALAALTSALGTDFGLSDARGLSVTGRFRLHVTGPTGLFFNFADASARTGGSPSLFWLARRYDDPVLAAGAREAAQAGASARDLLWYDPRGTTADVAALPLDVRYQAAHLACFRSAWNDKNALYVGFKGGDNTTNHAHLDLGTFVLDALGQRWAVDLGPDDYDLPGYFGAERWTYERLRTSGQNTLMLNGANQDPRAAAPLSAFRTATDGGFAIADLTAAYAPGGATRVNRGIALRDTRSRVLVQDEIEAMQPVDVTWTMHTEAAVEVDGARALLSQGGALLEARILSPADATFAVEELALDPPQQSTAGIRRLLIRLPAVTTAQLAVLFTPRRDAATGAEFSTPATLPGTPVPTPTPRPLPTDTLPLPEIVNLNRWALFDAPDAIAET